MKCSNYIVFLTFLCLEVRIGQGYYYGYTRSQQKRWPRDYPECGGLRQSPIRIQTGGVSLTYDAKHYFFYFYEFLPNQGQNTISAKFTPLSLNGYDRILPPLQLTNTGNSVDLSIDPLALEDGVPIPTITGGNLKSTYEFDGLHFHWNKANHKTTEHVIDGIEHPLELHIVHRNVKYTSEEAPRRRDGFAVLAILFGLQSQDSRELDTIIYRFDSIRRYNSSISFKPTFSLNSFLGKIDTRKWFHYEGSLTSPPCSESVLWHIFKDTLWCSAKQLKQFRQLRTVDRYGISFNLYENSRDLQPLNGRKVYFQEGK